MSRKLSTEKSRTATGYRIPPDIEKKMNQLIDSGEFDTRADLITTALRYYFDNWNKNIRDEVKVFLLSEDGRKFISEIIGQADERK
jgi:Arc/MetJ-type ribon-helix-helix transcriptional regulator